MSWPKWLFMRWIIRKAARSQGFLDPIELMARLRSFAQPSEVGEPVELLRAGVVFHARGLINSKVVQHNLDWVWPYWIERQFDPHDDAFIPRAFSVSHINLTHRNWTAIGQPGLEELPIVDPRGLLTPLHDGWSLDAWVIGGDGSRLLPSREISCDQNLELENGMAVTTTTARGGLNLRTTASVERDGNESTCILKIAASADLPGKNQLVLSLRPQNPEGISFIHEAALSADQRRWLVDNHQRIEFDRPAKQHLVSDYHQGDVLLQLSGGAATNEKSRGECKVGLVTAAALFDFDEQGQAELTVRIPLQSGKTDAVPQNWQHELQRACRLQCPEPRYQFLYDAAVRSLILHSPKDVYPGPYTYKRFWFRDAAFIINALLVLGLNERAGRALEQFPERQTPLGYFRSQEGEWDANGEVLWILKRYLDLTGKPLADHWRGPVERGARWICRKRLDDDLDTPHAGLLPAGFSAEHLGPNDYYYWDDFWCLNGLRTACELLGDRESSTIKHLRRDAERFATSLERSLQSCEARLGRPGMPAAPYRRLDAGAIGSLAVGYPLQDCAARDPRLLDCVEFLMQHCFVDGAFFQDMIHSGLNAYLTLHVAQVLLRAGDSRYLQLMDTVAELASPTGQWPEAIHPRTGGGCMGDGHHVWAAAEWIMMVRNCFVREEHDRLILCSGIPSRWLVAGERISLGPTPTPHGELSVYIEPADDGSVRVGWEAQWRGAPPDLEIRLPEHTPRETGAETGSVTLYKQDSIA